jgi:hypothetical protein
VLLVQLGSAASDSGSVRIVIEHLPTLGGEESVTAWFTGVAPDAPIIAQLKELFAAGCNRLGSRIVVDHLPARARIATAWFTGVAPDTAIRTMLEELRTANNDVIRGGIIVEPLPTVWGAGITVALDSGVAPDSAACTQLVYYLESLRN